MQLDELRGKIDKVDDELLRLFAERMEIVTQVAEYKKKNELPVLDRKREADKLNEIAGKVSPEMGPYAHILYDTLFELSRSYQSAVKEESSSLHREILDAIESTPNLFPPAATIACQGSAGAYSQLAADRLFKRPNIQYFKTFESVFTAIENGFCEYGVLPLENSTAGSVTKIYSLMQSRNFKIVRSLRLKIDHNLLVPKGVKLEDVREVFSHEQAIAQCAGFIEQLGPNMKISRCENTAAAAELVSESGRRDIAAICSISCAELYNLDCIARDIQ
ncbi:MAG: chorismate mutase, partial [Oscillospiraceae bacterium]|nr:chorismate mutase [Oscillospiraceae bacterium]